MGFWNRNKETSVDDFGSSSDHSPELKGNQDQQPVADTVIELSDYTKGGLHNRKGDGEGAVEGFQKEPLPEDKRVLVSWHDVTYGVKVSIPHRIPNKVEGLFPAFSRATAHWTYDVVLSAFFGNKMVNKEILHGVSGTAEPGKLIAIMGPSGSGKTTLLNILSGRVGQKGGHVLFNGQRRSKRTKRQLAYVMQEDVFFHNLTVEETLLFTAALRLDRFWDNKARKQRVNEVVDSLMLGHTKDTIIGNQMQRGVSGGERKRVNIANEMLTNPSVLFLDEPTSGLDSSTALALMMILKKLARSGMTIVTTLHQPSSQIYNEFDKLLLLAEGNIVYEGNSNEALQYFEKLGYPCHRAFNPADFFLSLLVDEDIHKHIEPRRQKLIDAWKKKEEGSERRNERNAIVREAKNIAEETKGSKVKKFATPFYWQFIVLMWRGAKQKRGDLFTALTFFQIAVMTTVVCLSWNDMQYTEDAIQDRVGYLFFTGVFFSFFSLFDALNTFPTERVVLKKERQSGSYRLSAYFLAKNFSEAPLIAFWPTLFYVIAYWIVNLQREPGHFFLGWTVMIIGCYAAESIGLAVSAAIMNVKRAIVFGSVLLLAMMLLGGFYSKNLSVVAEYLQYLSFIKYVYEGMLITEMDGATFTCASPSEYSSCPGSEITGAAVLDLQGISGEVWHKILCLIAFSLICRSIAYMFLRYLNQGAQWVPPTPYLVYSKIWKVFRWAKGLVVPEKDLAVKDDDITGKTAGEV